MPTLHRTAHVGFTTTMKQYGLVIKAAEDRGAQQQRDAQRIAQTLRGKS
ncbi:hypothetical protein QNM97_13890 [Gordonia sp. L191]|nr:hypothetical protein [Gordonia sp. L191]WHU45143.1 hypothetical protein QNM97_13890 [Gordonia sp. L191]